MRKGSACSALAIDLTDQLAARFCHEKDRTLGVERIGQRLALLLGGQSKLSRVKRNLNVGLKQQLLDMGNQWLGIIRPCLSNREVQGISAKAA